MKKAVIFDLDGTLANTLESLSYCTNKALADFGFQALPTEHFKRFVGNGAKMQIIRALREANDTEIFPAGEEKADADGMVSRPAHLEEVLARYLVYFEKDCMYQVRPYDGICELLETLKKMGIKIAVFSNKPHENTINVVDTLFGKDYFNSVQGQTDGMPGKPAPDGVYMLKEKLAADSKDILYVGDSSVDMDTAKAAGVMSIGVLWGFRSAEELKAHGADALISSPRQLLKYL